MGLWSKIMELFSGGASDATPASRASKAPPPQPETDSEPAEEAAEESGQSLDLAGFDPNDEESFFEAVLHMESEGDMGGTDASRAKIMQRFGIRDRSHWQTVKESVYATLAQKHGSGEEVAQREMNWRQGQMQKNMQAKVAKAAASGELKPVEGVSLEAWAAFNATLVQGTSLDDLLKGAGIDRVRWDRVNAEWNARMARDTTFAIATIYGNAFQSASKGKFGDLAREANAARAENRDLKLPPPMTMEQYYEIMYEQSFASSQGRDPAQALKSMGLSIIDWTDLGSYMGYLFHRTWAHKIKEYQAAHDKAKAKVSAKYPGAKADLDIKF